MYYPLAPGKGRSFIGRATALLAVLGMSVGTFVSPVQAEQVSHGVAAGLLKVDQNGDASNTNVVVTPVLAFNGFMPVKKDYSTNYDGVGFLWWNSADYYVQIGSSSADDVSGGVMLSSVAQNGRQNYHPDGWMTNAFPISAVTEQSFSMWRIVTYRNPTQAAGSGEEYNVNVAGAWFPYSKYIGALVRNSGRTNGGANNTLIGSADLTLGKQFVDLGGGKGKVDLTSMGIDSRKDGVLLVNHGKDENNFALAQANATNGTWNVFVKDMAQPTFGTMEQDPIAFVFIPKTNTSLISGKFNGDASIAMFSGSTPQFSVTPGVSDGRWTLKINGYSPATGVLIISAEGGGGLNTDNIVNYQPNAAGDGWDIESRDTPGMGLQTPSASDGGPEPVCSFVFIPAPTPGVTATPSKNILTSEAGTTATFSVTLDARPTADVTIAVSSSDASEGIADVSSLTFTPDNWDVPQTVTVTGQDDAQADGQIAYSIILGAATSADARYNGMKPADVMAINADNEVGITVSANHLTTTENGGTATFTVVLNTAPSADVTIGLSSTDTTEGVVSPASLTFTAADWNTPQTVTVTGQDDFMDDGDVVYTVVTAPATSADPAYSSLNPLDVSVVNIDDDAAGFTLSTNSVTVSEAGSSATFTVVLNSQPMANVTLSLSSSDVSEGKVSPASLVFTPANWNVAQTVTVTGVDDFTDNGVHPYNILMSVSSTDSVYAGLVPPSVSGTTLDNEAVITFSAGPTYYGIGAPGVSIDGQVTISDENASYNNGSLTVSILNGSASDRLEIRNAGTGPGQIGVSGTTVTYEGVTIGTASGASGATPLMVTLNSAVSPGIAQQLLRAVTYRSTGTAPVKETRTINVALNDGVGGTSSASKTVQVGLLHVYQYQNGADYGYGVYNGSADIELRQGDPDNALPMGENTNSMLLWVDYRMNDTPQVLMRFSDIVGSAVGQIPTNAIVISAELILNVPDSGNGGLFYRMLIPWNETNETWNSMLDGVAYDDAEARSTFSAFWGSFPKTDGTYSGASGSGRVSIGVTTDVQAWVNGETNNGWVIKPWDFGGNGTGFNPSEVTNVLDRPRLRVQWVPKDTPVAIFRQGVDGYTGAHDTQIRETDPTVNYGNYTPVSVDFEATSEMLDSQDALLRFDDIIGSAATQIPANSLIHSAVLELSSTTPDSVGDGGLIHAILQPWDDMTTTWSSWNDGIDANGIEAAINPTSVAGYAALNPDVQSGVNYFDVTSDVQAWAAGVRPNYGWAILPWPRGGNGWGFDSAESTTEAYRPALKVYFTPGALPDVITLQPPTLVAGKVQLSFTGTAGRVYTVQRSATADGGWTALGTTTAGSTGTATYTDNSPLPNAGFYRIAYP